MNHFTFVTTILILCLTISNSDAAPTQRELQGRLRHHREDVTLEASGIEPSIAGEREPKEAGANLKEEQEQEEQEQQRQVVREVKDLLKQLRQLGRWTVKVKATRTRDDDEGETSRQNWESEIQPRDSRAGLHGNGNSHGTLISKGW